MDEETPLLGLAAYRDWILLAEYLDGTLLYNSIAYKTGELLGLPYTNQIIPVDVTINGEYRGVYAFTEHKEVGPNRMILVTMVGFLKWIQIWMRIGNSIQLSITCRL